MKDMMKRWFLPSTLVAGAAMVVAGLAGVGTSAAAASSASSHYTVTFSSSYYTTPPDTHALVHWARCTKIDGDRKTNVIDYKVNPAGHSYRVKLVKRAIAKLTSASGLTFRYDGRTSYIPHNAISSITGALSFQALDQRRKTKADLVVAWALKGSGDKASNLLTGTEQGVGSIKWASGPTSQLRILEGAVVMERGQSLRHGFLTGGSEGTLLLHELGHAVGLQHFADPTQIMNASLLAQAPAGYAAGDRAGLDRVGSNTSCLTTPPLRPSND
jgi:hypothetical protein